MVSERAMHARLCGFGAIVLLAAAWVSVPVFGQDAPIAIESGKVSGTTTGGIAVFKGIPYSAPPVGPLRWQPPQPVPPWSGVLAATTFGGPCMQPRAPGPPTDLSRMGEDCLTLNVWAPPRRVQERLPVMVWIPGGGFFAGASSGPFPISMAMAAHSHGEAWWW